MLSLLRVMAAHHALILSYCLPTLHDLEREMSVCTRLCVCGFQSAHVFLQPASVCVQPHSHLADSGGFRRQTY